MPTERRHPNVVNKDELEPTPLDKGKHVGSIRRFGPAANNQQIGCSIMEVPPGKISFPFHYHCMNEEALYILSGTGTARIGERRVPVRAGDWIAFPVGPDHAHQMINDGDAPLVYLMLSTSHKCEVVGYPDSKKWGYAAGSDLTKPWVRQLSRDTLDYWDGEPDAK
jgi:uncharacterized cupin superfamily protein